MNVVTDVRHEGREAPTGESGNIRKEPFWRRRSLRIAGLGIFTALALAVIGHWLVQRWTHVSINDSRIAANLVTVSSEVSGLVTGIPVVGGQAIKKGALLVRIDRADAELAVAALEAQIAGIGAQQEQLRTEQAMLRDQIARKLDAGEAQIAASEALHSVAEAKLKNARLTFERVKALTGRQVAAQQQLDQAEADLTTAEQEERSASAGIRTAEANLAVTHAEEAQIAVLDRQIAVLETQKNAQLAERDRMKLEVAHGTIAADFDGVVDSTFIDAGEYVAPGTRLLIYHDPSAIWIDANVKETDFDRLKLGAPAEITVDAYPGRTFTGKVVRLGEAATSQFALLPSPNPSGNFTKITQRLPIRISIDQQDGLLRPGMMVEVSVDVVD